MRELDDLLTPDVARSAANATRPVDVESLVRRGRVRRRRRTVVVLAAVVLAVGGIGVGADSMRGGDQPPPVAPEPTPTIVDPETPEETGAERPGAEEIVDHPDSLLADVAISTVDPEVVLSVWSLCRAHDCDRSDQAVVLVRTGQDRVVLPMRGRWTNVEALRNGSFWVSGPRGEQILRADGTVVEVRRTDAVAPLGPDEVLAGQVAVDLTTGVAHPVVPEDGRVQLSQTADGQLRMLSNMRDGDAVTYSWSEDGGATWSSTDLTSDGNSLFVILPTADDAVHAIQSGGDGATMMPVAEFFVSTDGGATFESRPGTGDPMAYGSGLVLPDGSILLDAEGWSDEDLRKPGSGTPSGFHLSRGADWSSYDPLPAPVELAARPTSRPNTILEPIAGGARMTMIDFETAEAFTSIDLGASWAPVPTGRR